MRKIDLRVLPFLLLMYVMAFLDRTNVGFAESSFRASVGIGNAAYALGASLFFVGYAVLEVPSNLLLVRFGARLWLARIMVTWGLVSAAMPLVQGETSFYALRLLLGITEAGFFPGVIYYLTRFYPADHRGKAMGIFYIGAPLSFILGGPLSGALLTMDGVGGLLGWQWLFLVEGLVTAVVGLIAFACLSDGPQSATWLSPSEKAVLIDRLASEEVGSQGHGSGSLLAGLRSPIVLHFGAIFFIIQMTVYGLVFFMPTQIAAIAGREVGLVVGLLSTLPWFVALAATLTLPGIADRLQARRSFAMLLLLTAGLGLAGSGIAAGGVARMLCLCLAAASFIAVQPIFWAIASRRLPSQHRAATIALINSLGAVGSFVAPNLRVGLEHAFGAPEAGLLGLATAAGLGAILLLATGRLPFRPEPHAA